MNRSSLRRSPAVRWLALALLGLCSAVAPTALVGCASRNLVRVGSFDGVPDDQTARIGGFSETESFFGGLSGKNSDVQSIRFDRVNGTALDSPTLVEVPAGEVTIECTVSGYVDGGRDLWGSSGRATFVAEPGVHYRVVPKLSEHQWPWSLRVLRTPGGDVVANSEPAFEDLRIPERPPFARDWQSVKWFAYADSMTARFAPAANTTEEWLFSRRRVEPGTSAADGRIIAEQQLRHVAESFELLAADDTSFTADVTRTVEGERVRFLMEWTTDGEVTEVTSYVTPLETADPARFRLP